MKRIVSIALLIAAIFISNIADSQVIWRHRPGGGYSAGRRQQIRQRLPEFKPYVNISAGYGFPNLDRMYLPDYFGTYTGSIKQTGPVTASVDYRFNRRMSLGIMVTHGTVSTPYYNDGSVSPAFNAKFDNWSFMLNIVRYIPVPGKAEPYIRTAIGVNAWTQDYTDPDGNKAAVEPAYLPAFSYQAGIGARFKITKHTGLFLEAGYGKYIVHGGLSVKL